MGEDPSEGHLAGGRPVFLTDLLQPVRNLEDVREVLLGVSRNRAPVVVLSEVLRPFLSWQPSQNCEHNQNPYRQMTYVFSSQQAPAQRSVRDNLDPELAGGFQECDLLVFDIRGKGRIFDLDDRNRVHSVCAAQGLCADLGKAEVSSLACPTAKNTSGT